jgi:NADH:ubiquinone oxidoreductase subunit 6 (subunit J)
MTIFFLILAALTLAGTAAAMALRNPIHCILALTVGLVGLATLYLQLGAQFVGFTQVLVYVGAVAILAVFAIMMTQGGKPEAQPPTRRPLTSSLLTGGIVAGAVFAVLGWAILSNSSSAPSAPTQPAVSVNQIGQALMQKYVLPLEIMGLLLTAALIGAVILAMPQPQEKP